MKQKTFLKLIYKVHSKQLRKSKWDLNLPLETAMREQPELIVSLGDSQVLRFIDELNGMVDVSGQVSAIKRQIRAEKKKPRSAETKKRIKSLYKSLYELQFVKDYVCVVMDKDSDYDRANQGFKINGITYRRFLGTNGGIKMSTIVYVNAELYPELKRRLDNGRDMNKELVPAKLEAYQALICSGSTPLPQPNGIIVVPDCITHFKDDIILIDDSVDGEPKMTYEDGYDIEHNDSDGYGLMLPSYSRRVNGYLNGDSEHTISGMNTRLAFEKGMVYTFDYIDFAEKVAGTYEIIDAWGDKRDVRDAEVILTVSMLKLWDSYDSWEDYWHNCQMNHYEFSTPKITPDKLENVRNTNYQFLQSYDFNDDELQELCQPTIDEIKEVLGLDYRKSLVFLAGYGLTEETAFNDNYDYWVKALMADQRMINDPFIRKKIWNMICTRINLAKRGAIQINANFAMISGDPFALCQSMFGLQITGLLETGEIYHKYWIDKGATEISCFRAPMTAHNNVKRLRLKTNDMTEHWYKYMTTSIILNAWDTTCDAENGCDFDGDTFYTTNNPVILRNTRNPRTVICTQKRAAKVIPTEKDIVKANKLAFNDEIGIVTNHITSMFEKQSHFSPDSPEYKELEYRIICGQNFQQATIDRAKGVIAKSMPKEWYEARACRVEDGDSEEVIKRKKFNASICADKKPYFMTYVYPTLRIKNNKYLRNNNNGAIMRFARYGIKSISDLQEYEPKTPDMIDYLHYYNEFMPVGYGKCTVNRICDIFEKEFDGYLRKRYVQTEFDYTILKSNVGYDKKMFRAIQKIYQDYQKRIGDLHRRAHTENIDKDSCWMEQCRFVEQFQRECSEICTNEDILCDIVLDMCYGTERAKQFAWDICGDRILENLLNRNNRTISFPKQVDNGGDFEYCGVQFQMITKEISVEEEYYIE